MAAWAGLGYLSARAICSPARAKWRGGAVFPRTEALALRELPGLGAYTAAAVAAIAFGERAVVVDARCRAGGLPPLRDRRSAARWPHRDPRRDRYDHARRPRRAISRKA
jgi:hypothetical protein